MNIAKLIQELNSNYGLIDFHLKRDQEQVLKGQIWILNITIYSKKHWAAATDIRRITWEFLTFTEESIQMAFLKDMIIQLVKGQKWGIQPFDNPKRPEPPRDRHIREGQIPKNKK